MDFQKALDCHNHEWNSSALEKSPWQFGSGGVGQGEMGWGVQGATEGLKNSWLNQSLESNIFVVPWKQDF